VELIDHPLFNKYIIGSPSIDWGYEYILKQAEGYVANNDKLSSNVFMAVGALEEAGENAKSLTVTNLFRLENILKKEKLEGLDLRTRVFPDETHLSVEYMNYIHGIKTIYKKPEIHFTQKIFK